MASQQPGRDGPHVPFEIHRGVEYLLGLALASLALHQNGSATVLGAGLCVMAPAIITKGRFGVLRWCSTAMHGALDVALVGLLAVLPLLPRSGGPLVAATLEPCAAVLLVLAVRTDYRARHRRGVEEARGGASLTPEGDVAPPAELGAPLVDVAAWRLGRLAGRLRLAGRAAVATGRDVAQEHRDPDGSVPTRAASTGDTPPAVTAGADGAVVTFGRVARRMAAAARTAVEKTE